MLTAYPSVRQRDIEVSSFPITESKEVGHYGDRAVDIDTASAREIAFVGNPIAVDCWEGQRRVGRQRAN